MLRTRLAALALAASLIVAACQSTTPSSPGPSALAALPTPTATPTVAAPSPTAPPPDVAALFSTNATKLKTATFDVTGTETVGLVQSTIRGTNTCNGVDSLQTMTTTSAGVDMTTSTTQVAGKRYVQASGLPWLEAVGTASAHNLGSELAAAASAALTDAGTETWDGQQVHRLTVPAATAFDMDVLLPGVAGSEGLSETLAFIALADGTPVGATIEASWSATVNKKAVEASLSIDVKISQLGVKVPILLPDHVWNAYESSRWLYSVAYPDDFEYEKAKKYDYFNGPVYGSAYIARTASLGYSLNAIAKLELSLDKSYFKTSAGKNEAITVDGVRGRLLTVTGKNSDFTSKTTLYEVVVVKGKYVFFIGWFFKAGNEAADLVTFKQMIATLEFT